VPAPRTRSTTLTRVERASATTVEDVLAVEEPLEIRVACPGRPAVPLAVTMRTPGHDQALAAGFLLTEGIVEAHDDVVRPLPSPHLTRGEGRGSLTVSLTRDVDLGAHTRAFFATSSCGVCGKATIDRVELLAPPLGRGPRLSARLLTALPPRLRAAQQVFEATGGLHATGLFTADGELVCAFEDVGRHNAMDKAIGATWLADAPLTELVAVVSGRASFELVQKAAMAGLAVLVAVGAPSSLAVDAARRLGVSLVGFARADTFNVYAHEGRVTLP
jgi:FdhD protein